MEEINDSLLLAEEQELKVITKGGSKLKAPASKVTTAVDTNELPPSCLRNEIIHVKHIPRETGLINNPKHIYYGGMANEATRNFTVPVLESTGQYVNVLTNDEKVYLEYIMGLEVNALSIYRKNDNYWRNYTVRLTKGDNILDLSNPNNYIDYKVLLANKNFIAESPQILNDSPKVTYQFVMISDNEDTVTANKELNATMLSYQEFGAIKDNVDMLRVIVETIDGRPTAANSKLDFLQAQCNKLIQSNAALFLKVITDPLLYNKTLIKRAKEAGIIQTRGNYYYYEGSPLCENSQEPTLGIAAKYIGLPKYQEIKFAIEAKLKN